MVLLHGKQPLYGGIFDFHDVVIIAHGSLPSPPLRPLLEGENADQ